MDNVIVVTSGKGGVGKTTSTANIGAALARSGKSVVLVDTDIGLRNLDVVLGLENRIVFDLVDVVEGNCRVKQALIRDKRFDKLFLMPAAQTREKRAVQPEQMKKLIGELAAEADYVLIDCPAGIEQGFQNAIAAAKSAVVVTVPEVSSVRDADRIIGLLSAAGIEDARLLINRFRAGLAQKGDMLSVEDTQEILGIDLIGVVPEDEMIYRSSNLGEPIITEEKARAGEAYRNIASRILGENVPLIDLYIKDSFGTRFKKFMVKN